MIRKLDKHLASNINSFNMSQNIMVAQKATEKINELIDVINDIQKEREAERFEIQEWIGIIESVRESVNTNKKQIDELKTEVNKTAQNINFTQPEVKENVQDEFAEQRGWIGKLCVFWDNDDTQEFSYGVLTAIDTDFGVGYSCNGEYEYDNCEPVKPDDDIIYRGE